MKELKELRGHFNWGSEYRVRERLQMSLERWLRPHCKRLVCLLKIVNFTALLYEVTKLAPLLQGHNSLPAFTAWLVENVLGFTATLVQGTHYTTTCSGSVRGFYSGSCGHTASQRQGV